MWKCRCIRPQSSARWFQSPSTTSSSEPLPVAFAMPRWKSRSDSLAYREIVHVGGHAHDRLPQFLEVFRLLRMTAASAATSPSTSVRALSNSKGPGPLSPAIAAEPEPAVTKTPAPTRTSTRPPISSEMSASRTEVRETPSNEGQLAFGRQARTVREFAVPDETGDLVGDLAIEPTRFDGLQRQDGSSLRGPVDSGHECDSGRGQDETARLGAW